MAFYIGTTPDKLEQARRGFARDHCRNQGQAAAQGPVGRPEATACWANTCARGRAWPDRAGEAATDAVLHYPQDFQKQLLDKAATLAPADLQAVARKYLDRPMPMR